MRKKIKKEYQRVNELKESLSGEEWRDVAGFEGIYKISNMGRLISGKKDYWRILSNVNQKGGYLAVILAYENKVVHTRMHRLVYEAFVGEIPKGRKFHIHHIDENKQNNKLDNLVLETSMDHHKTHYSDNTVMGMNHYNKYVKTQKIAQKDINGNVIAVFNNGTEAHLATGVCQRNILQVAHKTPYNKNGSTRKQAGGFIWEIVD